MSDCKGCKRQFFVRYGLGTVDRFCPSCIVKKEKENEKDD